MHLLGTSWYRRAASGVAAVLFACTGNAGPPPTVVEIVADAPAYNNSASALIAARGTISRVEIVDVDDRHVIARLDARVSARLLEAIAEAGPRDAVGGVRPAWDVALLLWPRRGPPFVAHPIAAGRLRLNPRDPWSTALVGPTGAIDPAVQEVAAGTELFPALTQLLDTVPRER